MYRHQPIKSIAVSLTALVLTFSWHAGAVAHEGHDHHHLGHATSAEEKHPTTFDPFRFLTNRISDVDLPLPEEEDSFFFVVFGDRTGGPADGVRVLADAVREVNLLEPDLVMTVGDLIEGYNTAEQWMIQMHEYKGIMNGLKMPWFPVAGNHDVYWRGPDRPVGQHEENYEMHFGPLWYAVEHKDCWFFALYSDEGNPETGEKTFNKPECQRMSEDQLSWLRETLKKTKDAKHVFAFLHHPRWQPVQRYGDDWWRVHEVMVEAGNVTAVFAGHNHEMAYTGPIDGIEYVALGTVGGQQPAIVPSAGYLHEFHIVTVRPEHIAMAAIPIGEVMDVRAITLEVSRESAKVAQIRPTIEPRVRITADGTASQHFTATLTNPVSKPIDVSITPTSADSRWAFSPDHLHRVIEPGASAEFTFHAEHMPGSMDHALRSPEMIMNIDYLAGGWRFPIPEVRTDVLLTAELPKLIVPDEEMVLMLDGKDDCLRVPNDLINLPDGPLTLECWFNARSYGDRVGLVTKTENSEFGIFVSKGKPLFGVLVGDGYILPNVGEAVLKTDTWHHIAGVYDGQEARLYLDGKLVSTKEGKGTRRTNNLPLIIGGDVHSLGGAESHFEGAIDAVHLSSTARYVGEEFTPIRRPTPDEHTTLLFNMDQRLGLWTLDESNHAAHAIFVGTPLIMTSN